MDDCVKRVDLRLTLELTDQAKVQAALKILGMRFDLARQPEGIEWALVEGDTEKTLASGIVQHIGNGWANAATFIRRLGTTTKFLREIGQ